MSSALISAPEQGQLVSVRSRNWIVNEVVPSTLPTSGLQVIADPQTLVSLASVEDDGLGEEIQVVWELEPGARLIEKVALPDPTGFDPPDQLNAFLDAVRWGASSLADVRNIQSPFRSGIDIEDYQLDPVVRAIQMPRVNLLVADDVGLGKTIEAGMVALELIIRHRARKILIVCPSSLQIQWQEQMRDKFGLDFRIVSSELMKELRRERGIHVNPWNHFPRLITSIDFLKRERPLRMFREILPGPNDPIFPRKFDLLITDEAHNCAPSGRGKYATDSLRTKALRLLAPHFEHKLFLTATPHNGYPESFSALLELLDNQRFARSTKLDRKQLDAVMVRRMKSELPARWDGSPRFPKRTLEPLDVPYTDEEKAIHAALRQYAGLRSKRARDNPESIATDFVLKTLKKRLFSSPAAFLTTLNKHELSLRQAVRKTAGTKPTFGTLKRDIDRIDEDYADDEEYDEATGDAVDTASRLFSEPSDQELALIKRMRDWAERACSQNDSKARQLITWLKEHIRPNGQWTDERVILFTEYRATQKWLSEVMSSEGFTGQDRLMTMYGGMDAKSREAIKAAFQAAPDQSPVRILLATDAASEGIDLQNHCSKLMHYEIPWNPNRMEQRNGRIDRHGQKADHVQVFHFVSKGYKQRQSSTFTLPMSELDADLEFLMRVAQKVETIREDLGSVGQVLADDVEAAMLGLGYNLARTDNADLCAYFALRAASMLRDGGQFGFLATNTIAQGDTREVGLDQLTANGCVIPRAVPSQPWPGTATLEVAHVWIRRGRWNTPFLLNDKPVSGITPFLAEPGIVSGPPHRLFTNAGKSFQGSVVLGLGFVLEPEEAQRLIDKNPRNKDVLFPYLNGEDLNSRPDQSPSRWVINFFDWPLDRKTAPVGHCGPVAADYPDCLAIVEKKVKPEREKLGLKKDSSAKGYARLWWHYGRRGQDLYRTIAGMERVLVRARIANIHSMVWVPAGWVYNEKTVVFVHCPLSVMQSNVHEAWARNYSSTLRTDMQYTPSDCFETFPFPHLDDCLDSIDQTYLDHRRQVMLNRQEGLTKTYHRFHDPEESSADIQKLRDLHVEMDNAVAAAYGWSDLHLGHGFHETKQGARFTISESARREVLARLLKLNHERYAEEVAQGLHGKKGKPKVTGRKGKRTPSDEESLLF